MAQKTFKLDEGTCLDRYIQTEIQAPFSFVSSAQELINLVARILHSSEFPYSVAEVVKSGSLGQGIALQKNLSDIDLVVYLNNYTVESITPEMTQILTKMHKTLLNAQLPGYRFISKDEYRLGIVLETQGQSFEVDLLPGVPISGSLQSTYKEMSSLRKGLVREHYSVTFAKQQILFIKQQMTKLKNLLQLMKYWTKVDAKSFGCRKFPSYAMSLIVIHTWEEHGKPQNFKMEKAFKAVLTTLFNYQQLHKVWFDNYDQSTWQRFGGCQRPYLIDPANPDANIIDSVSNWDAVVKAAKCTLESPLLRRVYLSPNWQ